MAKLKKVVIGILVVLIVAIFYKESKLKNSQVNHIETKKEIKQSEDLVKNSNVILENQAVEEIKSKEIKVEEVKEKIVETKENEILVKLDENSDEIKQETTEENSNLENKIVKDWEEQDNHSLIEQADIELEEKVILENLEYTIKKGDTISDLSKEYKIKTDYIYANNVDKNLRVLQIGKKINIPTESGIFYSVKKGDTFEGLSKRFEVDIKTIKEDNEIDSLLIGTKLFLREPKVSKYLDKFKEKYVKKTDFGTFSNPLVAMRMTSTFGTRKHPVLKRVLNHAGIDLKAKVGTRVSSVRQGVVSFVGRASGYGKLIIIKHADGYESRYAHLSKISVKKGQKVSQNQFIGLSGATGRVSGPHLHFEIRKNGKIKNPLTYLKF